MTRQPTPPTPDLPSRLTTFRQEVRLAASHLTREGIERVMGLAGDLNLPDHDIQEELDEIRACADALALADDIARGTLPVVACPEALPAGDVCHFATPVRFGRRRTDQFGHLELTNSWLKFRAALDVSVAWTEVLQVRRTGREVVVALVDSTRPLRFWCPCVADAARATVLAEHFVRLARNGTSAMDATCHAWA